LYCEKYYEIAVLLSMKFNKVSTVIFYLCQGT